MVALPGQLFYSTQIPVCLWFIARDKKNGRFRDRRGETLFIDARKLGTMIDRVHRDLQMRTFGKSPMLIMPGAGTKTASRSTPMCPASANRPLSMTSATTTTFSPRADTSALSRLKMTMSRSRRRWYA